MDLDKIINTNNNSLKRLYSLFFLIPIYFFSIVSNNYLSTLIIFLTSLILSFEWFKITQNYIQKKNIILFSLLILANLFISTLTNFFYSIIFTIFFSSLILSKIFFYKYSYNKLSWLLYGFTYITIPLIIFFDIKEGENGIEIILWLLIIICITDIFSYIFGNLIKCCRSKLSPFLDFTYEDVGRLKYIAFESAYLLYSFF